MPHLRKCRWDASNNQPLPYGRYCDACLESQIADGAEEASDAAPSGAYWPCFVAALDTRFGIAQPTNAEATAFKKHAAQLGGATKSTAAGIYGHDQFYRVTFIGWEHEASSDKAGSQDVSDGTAGSTGADSLVAGPGWRVSDGYTTLVPLQHLRPLSECYRPIATAHEAWRAAREAASAEQGEGQGYEAEGVDDHADEASAGNAAQYVAAAALYSHGSGAALVPGLHSGATEATCGQKPSGGQDGVAYPLYSPTSPAMEQGAADEDGNEDVAMHDQPRQYWREEEVDEDCEDEDDGAGAVDADGDGDDGAGGDDNDAYEDGAGRGQDDDGHDAFYEHAAPSTEDTGTGEADGWSGAGGCDDGAAHPTHTGKRKRRRKGGRGGDRHDSAGHKRVKLGGKPPGVPAKWWKRRYALWQLFDGRPGGAADPRTDTGSGGAAAPAEGSYDSLSACECGALFPPRGVAAGGNHATAAAQCPHGRGVAMDRDSWWSVTPQAAAEWMARQCLEAVVQPETAEASQTQATPPASSQATPSPPSSVPVPVLVHLVDLFGGTGGNAIAFARAGAGAGGVPQADSGEAAGSSAGTMDTPAATVAGLTAVELMPSRCAMLAHNARIYGVDVQAHRQGHGQGQGQGHPGPDGSSGGSSIGEVGVPTGPHPSASIAIVCGDAVRVLLGQAGPSASGRDEPNLPRASVCLGCGQGPATGHELGRLADGDVRGPATQRASILFLAPPWGGPAQAYADGGSYSLEGHMTLAVDADVAGQVQALVDTVQWETRPRAVSPDSHTQPDSSPISRSRSRSSSGDEQPEVSDAPQGQDDAEEVVPGSVTTVHGVQLLQLAVAAALRHNKAGSTAQTDGAGAKGGDTGRCPVPVRLVAAFLPRNTDCSQLPVPRCDCRGAPADGEAAADHGASHQWQMMSVMVDLDGQGPAGKSQGPNGRKPAKAGEPGKEAGVRPAGVLALLSMHPCRSVSA